jgi:hypothetical protein
MRAIFWLGLLLPALGWTAEGIKRKAILFLPDRVECQSGAGTTLAGEVGFRWDEEEPLYLHLWSNAITGKLDQVFGAIMVFDENGRELDKLMHVTVPLTPDGGLLVKKGEVKRFKIYQLYSTVVFPRPGNYYAIATVSYALAGDKDVEFRTNKRWFKVIEALPKRTSL